MSKYSNSPFQSILLNYIFISLYLPLWNSLTGCVLFSVFILQINFHSFILWSLFPQCSITLTISYSITIRTFADGFSCLLYENENRGGFILFKVWFMYNDYYGQYDIESWQLWWHGVAVHLMLSQWPDYCVKVIAMSYRILFHHAVYTDKLMLKSPASIWSVYK